MKPRTKSCFALIWHSGSAPKFLQIQVRCRSFAVGDLEGSGFSCGRDNFLGDVSQRVGKVLPLS